MQITNLDISFENLILYKDFSISFADNAITAILGPSGCGKTTLLNAIAFKLYKDRVSYIFQEPRLLPWCTIEKNITLTLEGNKTEKQQKARAYLERVNLLNRAKDYPEKLSGGERQRVAIARAFASTAPILLMDEPFQSQDPGLKTQLINLVLTLQKHEKRTIISVSHDIRDALSLAEHIVILGNRPVSIVFDKAAADTNEAAISEELNRQTEQFRRMVSGEKP
ncbi:ABC transporter ATP-binding protein [Brucepastera parasyntrophica]|uniref:ABC transporter ATP-binding protein n=1 Tax=Brucepastera parasyntrophica TaxID=2880008 RepID=UPI00210D0753|nr:ABC transporter ATP-binding protein [Brucepastera parasyntrophica]ULQ59993.1 ABC transporter ATP-binding protein [Brucepastera parasyntrophica]